MKTFIRTTVTAGVLAFASCAHAQPAGPYPAGPIRLVVGVPPGGNVDTLARVLVKQLETQLPHPIVVDNRGGVSGIVGYDIVAKARPDGYTLLSTAFPLAVNPSLYKSLPYNTEKDFAPITNYVKGAGYLLTINPSVPAKSVKELQAPGVRDYYAKNGYEPLAQPPAEFRKVFIADIARYAEIVRAAKIEKQ